MLNNNNRVTTLSKAISIFLLVFLLSSCASLPPREKSIKVNLSNLRLLDSTLFEQRFEASIRIQNRSQSELNIRGLSYDLSLNDKDFASGVSDQKITISPLSEGVISINLTSTLFGLLRQVKSMQDMQRKPFSYDLYGSVYTESDLFGIKFSEKGQIDLTTPGTKTK